MGFTASQISKAFSSVTVSPPYSAAVFFSYFA
nr:MAG TPA: hypothetical protein [Caudoviricetes sp.]